MSEQKNLSYEEMDFTGADQLLEKLIQETVAYMGEEKTSDIRESLTKAYLFAREAHGTQMRKSGDPYITHPLEASRILLSVKPDITTIQACILHDVIEDTPQTEDDIRENFGDDVAKICQ